MKYCSKCGNQIMDEAYMCPACGCKVERATSQNTEHVVMAVVTKVFLIIGIISSAFMCLIPLAWTLPIGLTVMGKQKRGEPISTGLKVCTLIFVNLIAGVLLFCDNDN